MFGSRIGGRWSSRIGEDSPNNNNNDNDRPTYVSGTVYSSTRSRVREAPRAAPFGYSSRLIESNEKAQIPEKEFLSTENVISILKYGNECFENIEKSLFNLIKPTSNINKQREEKIAAGKKQIEIVQNSREIMKKYHSLNKKVKKSAAMQNCHVGDVIFKYKISQFEPSVSRNAFCCNKDYVIIAKSSNAVTVFEMNNMIITSSWDTRIRNVDLEENVFFELDEKFYIISNNVRYVFNIGQRSIEFEKMENIQEFNLSNGVTSIKCSLTDNRNEINVMIPGSSSQEKTTISIEGASFCYNGNDLTALVNNFLVFIRLENNEIVFDNTYDEYKNTKMICCDEFRHTFWTVSSSDDGYQLECRVNYDGVDSSIFNIPKNTFKNLGSKIIDQDIDSYRADAANLAQLDQMIRYTPERVTIEDAYKFIDLNDRDSGFFLFFNNLKFMAKDPDQFTRYLFNIFVPFANPKLTDYAIKRLADANVLREINLAKNIKTLDNNVLIALAEIQFNSLISEVVSLMQTTKRKIKDELELIENKFAPLVDLVITSFIRTYNKETPKLEFLKLPLTKLMFSVIKKLFIVVEYTSVCYAIIPKFSEFVEFVISNFISESDKTIRGFCYDTMMMFGIVTANVIQGCDLPGIDTGNDWLFRLYNNSEVGEMKPEIKQFIENENSPQMEAIYKSYKAVLNKKLSPSVKNNDKLILMVLSERTQTTNEVLNFKGGKRSTELNLVLDDMLKMRSFIIDKEKKGELFNVEQILKKARFLLTIRQKDVRDTKRVIAFLKTEEDAEEFEIFCKNSIQKIRGCFGAFACATKALNNSSSSEFPKGMAEVFLASIVNIENFQKFSDMMRVVSITHSGVTALKSFCQIIFHIMKTTKDYTILSVICKLCKAVNSSELNNSVLEMLTHEERTSIVSGSQFFPAKFILYRYASSLSKNVLNNAFNPECNLLFINEFLHNKEVVGDEFHSILDRFLECMDDYSMNTVTVGRIISNIIIKNRQENEKAYVLEKLMTMIRKIGSLFSEFHITHAASLVHTIRAILRSDSIYVDDIKTKMREGYSESSDFCIGVLAVLGMMSEPYDEFTTSKVTDCEDGKSYLLSCGKLFLLPIPEDLTKQNATSKKYYIEPEDLLPVDSSFFEMIFNCINFIGSSDPFNLVFAQTYSYYLRSQEFIEKVKEDTDNKIIAVPKEMLITFDSINDKLFAFESKLQSKSQKLHMLTHKGNSYFITDPLNPELPEVSINAKSENADVSFGFVTCTREKEFESSLVTVSIPSDGINIVINREQKKITYGTSSYLSFPKEDSVLHLIFTKEVTINAPEGTFSDSVAWLFDCPIDYEPHEKLINPENINLDFLNIPGYKPHNPENLTLIPNEKCDNVSEGIIKMYNHYIVKKMATQWYTIITAQYVPIINSEPEVEDGSFFYFLKLTRVILGSYYSKKDQQEELPWRNTKRLDGLPYHLDSFMANAFKILFEKLNYALPDFAKAMSRTPMIYKANDDAVIDSPLEVIRIITLLSKFDSPNSSIQDCLETFMDVLLTTNSSGMLDKFISLFKGKQLYFKALKSEADAIINSVKINKNIKSIISSVYSLGNEDKEVTMDTKFNYFMSSYKCIKADNMSKFIGLVSIFAPTYDDPESIPYSLLGDLFATVNGFWQRGGKIFPTYIIENSVYIINNPSSMTMSILVEIPNRSIVTVKVGSSMDSLSNIALSRNKIITSNSKKYYISTENCTGRENAITVSICFDKKENMEISRIKGQTTNFAKEEDLQKFYQDCQIFASMSQDDMRTLRDEIPEQAISGNITGRLESIAHSSKLKRKYSFEVIMMRLILIFELNAYLMNESDKSQQFTLLHTMYPHLFTKKISFIIISNDAQNCASDNTINMSLNRKTSQMLIDGTIKDESKSLIAQVASRLSKTTIGKGLWRVTFDDEPGVDAGGLKRDAFQQTFESFFNVTSKVVCPCYNKTIGKHNSDYFLPVPSSTNTALTDSIYKAFGQLLVCILYTGYSQYIPFPPIVWKLIFNKNATITIDEIKSIDDKFCSEHTTWTCNDWLGKKVTLPGHKEDEAVKEEDISKYELQCVNFRVLQLSYATNLINKGFTQLYSNIQIFGSWEKLPEMLQNNVIDISVFLKYLRFENVNDDDPFRKMFIEVVSAFDQEELKNLLKFATGSAFIPLYSKEFKFVVNFLPRSEKLPEGHTCFYKIDIPKYETKEKMSSKIILAISNCNDMGMA